MKIYIFIIDNKLLVFWLNLLLEYLNINNITEKYSDETEDECGTMCQAILKMHDVVKINV
jgi:hypothetical protein